MQLSIYQFLLPLHSWFRWLVLISLVFSIYRAYRGKQKKLPFSAFDQTIKTITVKIVQVQFCIGLALYALSPVVRYFLGHFQEAVKLREIRFFGMEHITVMVIAVAVISIGSDKVDKAAAQDQYKIMALWFLIALLLILTSIPWSFSPLTSRPNFRGL